MRFGDPSGWYALFVPADVNHCAATQWMAANPGPFFTTDYIVDETLTLIRARKQHAIALDFGEEVFSGLLGPIHFLTRAEIGTAWDVFWRYADKEWSFTDCTSKVAMESLGIASAFAFDQHFYQFGTVAVVP